MSIADTCRNPDLINGTRNETLYVFSASKDMREGVTEGGRGLDGWKTDLPCMEKKTLQCSYYFRVEEENVKNDLFISNSTLSLSSRDSIAKSICSPIIITGIGCFNRFHGHRFIK